MSAGIKTIEIISKDGFFELINKKTEYLVNGLKKLAKEKNCPFSLDYEGGMFGFIFTNKQKVLNYKDVSQSKIDEFVKFFQYMLAKGIFFAPSPYEAGFISSAHSKKDFDLTHKSFKEFLELQT